MADSTEEVRKELQQEVNQGTYPIEGVTFTTEQLREQFEVLGFAAPFVVVEALEELGYKCETSYGSHNNYICTVTKDTTSIEVDEDNLRRSLPRDVVTF